MPSVFGTDFFSKFLGSVIANPDPLPCPQAYEEVERFSAVDQMVEGLAGIKHDRSDDACILKKLEGSVYRCLRGSMTTVFHFMKNGICLEHIICFHDQIEDVGSFPSVFEIM